MPTNLKLSFEELSKALQGNEESVTAVRITSVCEVVFNGKWTMEIHPFPTEFRIKEILRKLESHTHLRHLAVKAKSHAPMIARSTSLHRLLPASRLTDLELESFHFDSSVSFAPIAEAAMKCLTLSKISLTCCKMDRECKNQLLSMLKDHYRLRALHIVGEGNDFGESLARFLVQIIRQSRLTEISFTVPEYDIDTKSDLIKAFEDNSTLEHVNMVVHPSGPPLILEKRDRTRIKHYCERNKLSNRFDGLVAIQETFKPVGQEILPNAATVPSEEAIHKEKVQDLAVPNLIPKETVQPVQLPSSLSEPVVKETFDGRVPAEVLVVCKTTPDTSFEDTETSFTSAATMEETTPTTTPTQPGEPAKGHKKKKKRLFSKIFRGRKGKEATTVAP